VFDEINNKNNLEQSIISINMYGLAFCGSTINYGNLAGLKKNPTVAPLVRFFWTLQELIHAQNKYKGLNTNSKDLNDSIDLKKDKNLCLLVYCILN
jgi:hypothetical protein